jgi:pimeloyl-ACP methyl ester carboxylesterase
VPFPVSHDRRMTKHEHPTDEAVSASITLNGLRFHYLDWGNEGAPPLLLLHGFTGHARHWEYVAGELRSSFHVLALDQRGHGDSEWAPVYGSGPMVDDLAAFVDALELDGLSLVGMSMGGINALLYTAEHGDGVSRLVLGDIGPEVGAAGVARIRQQVASRDTFESIDDAYEFSLANNPRAVPWALRQRVEHNLTELPDGTLTWKYDRALRDGSASRVDAVPDEQWERWRAIHVPTLIVRGTESDILSDEIAQRMLDEQPNAELVTIEASGHTLTIDQPEAFVAVVRAWLGQPASR